MRALYKCEICNTLYNTPEEALICESQEPPPPMFNVGEEVYVLHRYPEDPTKPFGKRTIIEHRVEGHTNHYYLNRLIKVGKYLDIGTYSLLDYDNTIRPMEDIDYGVYCFRLGDKVNFNREIEVTLDLVDDN